MLSISRLLPAAVAVATVLIASAQASAEFFSSVPIDGPSADIVAVGDLDLARDGQGAVTYLRNIDGSERAFVARFSDGRFTAPVQIDGGLVGASEEPVVAAADGGRMAAAFTTDGTIFTTVFNPASGNWSAPQPIAAGDSPAIDLSIHGAGFLTFTSAGDVRAARLERGQTNFTLLEQPLDVDPARVAGAGNGRSRVAIGADSTAIAVWGEGGRVYARRLYRQRISTAPIDLMAAIFDERVGVGADLPEIGIEDDSSFAQITFRETFTVDGSTQSRVLARRLRGSTIDDPVAVDGSVWGADNIAALAVDINGRGEGLVTTGRKSGTVTGSVLKADVFSAGSAIGAAGGVPTVASATAGTAERVASWISPGDLTVRSRFYDDRTSRRVMPTPGPDSVVSLPDFGPVDPAGGLASSADRIGDFMTAFIQGSGNNRRLVYSVYDRPPASFSISSAGSWRNPTRVPIVWSAATDLWGGATYIISVNGREVGRTAETKITLPPTAVSDGIHNFSVTAVDSHGQSIATPVRPLRVDRVGPRVAFRVRRSGRRVTVRTQVADVLPRSGRASGVKYVRIDFGDGSARIKARRASHNYSRSGPMTVRVSATDRAGNVTVKTRRIRIPKA